MINLEDINTKCYNVFNFYYGMCDKMYASELLMNEETRIRNLKQELDTLISDNLDNSVLYQKNEEIYYIQLYIIHFLDLKLEDEQFIKITNSLLSIQGKQPNFLSPLVLILMSEENFTEDIIRKIYTQCEMELLSAFPKLGNKPYDYRYHLLKRAETPEDIRSKILSSYDELTEEEMLDFMQEILDELNSELYKYHIKNMDEVAKYPDLKREHHFFEIMKNYYNNRLKKEKTV